MSAQTHPPFPDGRIYTAVVIELCQNDWSLTSCPVCNSESAILREPNHAAYHLCCPICQRFTITQPVIKSLEALARLADGKDLKDRLSRKLAVSPEPVYLGSDTAWALSGTRPAQS